MVLAAVRNKHRRCTQLSYKSASSKRRYSEFELLSNDSRVRLSIQKVDLFSYIHKGSYTNDDKIESAGGSALIRKTFSQVERSMLVISRQSLRSLVHNAVQKHCDLPEREYDKYAGCLSHGSSQYVS